MQDAPLTEGLFRAAPASAARPPYRIGILPGEGIGSEIFDVCLKVLDEIASLYGHDFEIRRGGLIGWQAVKHHGRALPDETVDFCRSVFAAGGAILAGPGGGRFVYELRSALDLFVKLNPLTCFPELEQATRVKISPRDRPDVVVVRDNRGGLYQGRSRQRNGRRGKAVVHRFTHTESEVSQLLSVAAQLAARRRGKLTVVLKDGALPELSELWGDCALAAARTWAVELQRMEVDFAAYQLIAQPGSFDVVAAPNCFGDILADIGGLLMGSRGVTYGANFTPQGFGVYQTNHGAAYDLAGKDIANPAAQLLALAMLLRESFGLGEEAALIGAAVRRTWRDGWRTADVMAPGCHLVGTAEMGTRVLRNVAALASERSHEQSLIAA